jgi:hypothetical protein
MSQFVALKTAGMNSEGLKLKTLDGKSYLTGSVVMAKEMVMNGLMYTKEELKRAVPGWNGRPVTVGHPKSDDGAFITANDPKILDETQIGFIFDAYYRDTDNKLTANVWLDASKLDKFTDVRDAITNERTLEVSTGLFLDLITEEGVHSGKKYKGKAVNHLPDHLALLPNEVGACSVADGAGFPRVNVMLGTNEVTFRERSRLIRQALQAKIASGYFYVEEIFDASVVVYKDPAGLFAYDYTFDKETGTLTLGEGVEVFQKIEYPPISTLGANMDAVKNVEDKPVVKPEAAVNAAPDKPVEGAVVDKPVETPEVNKEKPVAPEVKPEVAVPEVNAEQVEALALLATSKQEAIAKITANSEAGFTVDELKAMPYTQLKKIAALAGTTQAKVDMSGLGGPGGTVANQAVKETPYIG